VEVDGPTLRRYALTFDELVRAIRLSSLDLPAGAIKRTSGEILLRTKGQAYTGEQVEALILRTDPDGTVLRVGDVASVHDTLADQDKRAMYGGEPALFLYIYRVGNQDLLDVARTVHAYADEIAPSRLPANVSFTVASDRSEVFRDRMDTLKRNAVMGLILVFLLLGLFLRLGLAFWVSLGIPMSFLGAFWLIPQLGGSINMLSMFSFILVLGIVVDDAIVVGESVHAHQERGLRGDEAAVRGSLRVASPVIFAVLTSIIAFAPMLGISGWMGKFWRVIPIVVMSCLAFSLVECLLVLPAHLSHQPRAGRSASWLRPVEAVQAGVSRALAWFLDRIYTPLLALGLKWRYFTLALFISALVVAVGYVKGGHIRQTGFPRIPAEWINVAVEMPAGTNKEVTWGVMQRLQEGVEELREQIDRDHPAPLLGPLEMRLESATSGRLRLDLENITQRAIEAPEILRRWRERVGEVPGVKSIEYRAELGGRGADITVQFSGTDMAALEAAADLFKQELDAYDGVYNILDTYSEGKEELVLALKPSAAALGLRLADLARQVRQAFYGAEAQRVLRGREELKIMVRYPEATRNDLSMLDEMRIRTDTGSAVPFNAVAAVERGVGYPTIQRKDRRRVVEVSCEVDPAIADSNDIQKKIEDEIFHAIGVRFPEVGMRFEGGTRDNSRAMAELRRGFIVALIAMYALMAVAFKHYFQPLLVMSAIPFGMVGALIGHILLGFDLSMLSMFGIVALAGVVVNDALVLVDAINYNREREGMALHQALVAGGRQRFRPILLTTLTTFFGLLPLMAETSLQARFLIPMAISLAFGVLFATTITLLLVPALYVILEDLGRLWQRGCQRLAADRSEPGD
ncbi:MAG: efflux RND transporter permease subunit, partial [Planctomycetota bacterium]